LLVAAPPCHQGALNRVIRSAAATIAAVRLEGWQTGFGAHIIATDNRIVTSEGMHKKSF
jgi:hypothetical protein